MRVLMNFFLAAYLSIELLTKALLNFSSEKREKICPQRIEFHDKKRKSVLLTSAYLCGYAKSGIFIIYGQHALSFQAQRLKTGSTICKIYERDQLPRCKLSCYLSHRASEGKKVSEVVCKSFSSRLHADAFFHFPFHQKSSRTFCSPHVYDMKY